MQYVINTHVKKENYEKKLLHTQEATVGVWQKSLTVVMTNNIIQITIKIN